MYIRVVRLRFPNGKRCEPARPSPKIKIEFFFLRFAGMTVTNYLDGWDNGTTANNATLAVLEGAVAVRDAENTDEPMRLVSGESVDVFGRHAVTTVSATPSCYLYSIAGGEHEDPPPATTAGHDRPGCSDACYAFAFDAMRTAFSSVF